ncbi:MAG TPA: hypothetical protein VNI60_03280 [Pyrinomonadaceae bacterium]|nr:hypothetical protein [Pyrinomonadaceae bacterium]
MRTARTMWMILIPIFAVLVLFNLYNWTRGKDGLSGILSPLGMMFVGLASITGSRNKPLSYIFLVLGMLAVIGGLVTAIMKI